MRNAKFHIRNKFEEPKINLKIPEAHQVWIRAGILLAYQDAAAVHADGAANEVGGEFRSQEQHGAGHLQRRLVRGPEGEVGGVGRALPHKRSTRFAASGLSLKPLPAQSLPHASTMLRVCSLGS